MTKQNGLGLAVLVALAAAVGCTEPQNGLSVLTATPAEPAGINCANGGTRIDTGLDDNDNRLLDLNEIDSTAYVCDGAEGAMGVAGATGPQGIDGARGKNGADGANGLSALVETRKEPAGEHCAAGGTQFAVGVDQDADGVLAETEITEVSFICALGCEQREEVDTGDDGMVNVRENYTYDAFGNLLRYGWGDPVNGTFELESFYTYDEHDRWLKVEHFVGGYGQLESIETYTYDDNGDQLTARLHNSAAELVEMYTYTYNDTGKVLTESYDANGDGTGDSIITHAYDARGDRLTTHTDTDGDGVNEFVETNTYDEGHHKLLTSTVAFADGTSGTKEVYQYNDMGSETFYAYDSSDEGGEYDLTVIKSYDDNQNRISESRDTDANLEPDYREELTYNDSGKVLQLKKDLGADGVVDHIVAYTYDVRGNRLTWTEQEGGVLKSFYSYTYNANNEMTTSRFDTTGDGNVDTKANYYYNNGVCFSIGGPFNNDLPYSVAFSN